MDINTLFAELATLGGVAALIAVAVNALKQFGVVKDGDAPAWVTGLNLIALVALFVAHIVGFDVKGLDGVASTIAQLGALILSLVGQVLVSKAANFAVRGTPVVGYSHSLADK